MSFLKIIVYVIDKISGSDLSNSIERSDPDILSINYTITFEKGELYYLIHGSRDLSIRTYILENNPEYDFFTAEEKDIVTSILLSDEVDRDVILIYITKDRIDFKFANSGFVNLMFVSPVIEVNYKFPTDASDYATYMDYEYIDDINDDWGIYVYRSHGG